MKKLLTILFLLLSSFTLAQNTSVTGQITDAGGQAWNNGTFSFTFVGPQNVLWTGGTLNPNASITGSLSASGAIPATNIPDNNQITPGGTQWSIRVCSATLPTTCFSNTLTITGAAQTVNLTPGAIKFLVPTVPSVIAPISAYADAEISGGWVGFQYYNLVSTATRLCTVVTLLSCSSWTSAGGIGTVLSNNGSVGAIANYAAAGGSNTVGPDANLDDGGTTANTLTYKGTGGIAIKPSSGTAGLTLSDGTVLNNGSSAAPGVHIWAIGDMRMQRGGGNTTDLIIDDGSGAAVALQASGSANAGNGAIIFANTSNTFDAGASRVGPGTVAAGNGANGDVTGSYEAAKYLTSTNCQLGGATGTASPAACGSAASGSVAIPASQTSYVVNTTAVTANSHIIVQQITDNSGIATATCNTGATTPIQSARTAATSFTITLTSVASVTCIQYWIVN